MQCCYLKDTIMSLFDDLLSRRKQEEELRRSKRLPPGQELTTGFPVLTYGPNPPFDPATWDLRVWGEVEKPMRWTWEEFLKLPTKTVTAFKEFVKLFGLKPTAKFVIAHCDYGYTTNLPIEAMMDDDVLLAYKYAGEPLTPDHGAPLRTLVPKRYFWKSAKFLRGLEFSAVDKPGFWEQGGYHNDGDPWKEERFGRRGFF
jgi:DMSO/TMAO reductase YedYZ molybdopterin-dependent catalytic subunit